MINMLILETKNLLPRFKDMKIEELGTVHFSYANSVFKTMGEAEGLPDIILILHKGKCKVVKNKCAPSGQIIPNNSLIKFLGDIVASY